VGEWADGRIGGWVAVAKLMAGQAAAAAAGWAAWGAALEWQVEPGGNRRSLLTFQTASVPEIRQSVRLHLRATAGRPL
jgi:hypothetical protein